MGVIASHRDLHCRQIQWPHGLATHLMGWSKHIVHVFAEGSSIFLKSCIPSAIFVVADFKARVSSRALAKCFSNSDVLL